MPFLQRVDFHFSSCQFAQCSVPCDPESWLTHLKAPLLVSEISRAFGVFCGEAQAGRRRFLCVLYSRETSDLSPD